MEHDKDGSLLLHYSLHDSSLRACVYVWCYRCRFFFLEIKPTNTLLKKNSRQMKHSLDSVDMYDFCFSHSSSHRYCHFN